MKHRLYSIPIAVLGLFVLAACSNEPVMSAPEAPAQAELYRIEETTGPGRGISYPVSFDSEARNQAGYMMISNDAQNLYLGYFMSDNWRLNKSRVFIGRSMEDIPLDDAGRPVVESFTYGFELDRGMSSYTYRIPLAELKVRPGQFIAIGSYATVQQLDGDFSSPSSPGQDSSWWFSSGYRLSRPVGVVITDDYEEIITRSNLEF